MKTPQISKKQKDLQLEKEALPFNGKRIFAYLRRSTNNKQELSLQRQEDEAEDTIKKNGFNENEVQYYIESKTAFNGVKEHGGILTRKRTQFTKMLKDIDDSTVPVIILAYEPSRLSRNDKDAGEITDRLFGEYNKAKQKIERVIFNSKDTWIQSSDKGAVKQILLDAYKESLSTGKRSSQATLRELRKGRYVLSTPRGINRLRKGEGELKLNPEMPYIHKAWEMRAEGKSKTEINKYLARNNIKIGNSFERYFKTYIYMGSYPDPETGEMINMRFAGGKPPITEKLWNSVQETLGVRRVSKYGNKQQGDILSYLLKWEQDTKKASSFTVEFPKGKYKSFKSNSFGGFNKSELKILKECLPQIVSKLVTMFYGLSGLQETIETLRLTRKNEVQLKDGKVIPLVPKSKKEILEEYFEKKRQFLEIDSVKTEKLLTQEELEKIEIWKEEFTLPDPDKKPNFNALLQNINFENFPAWVDLHRKMKYLTSIEDGREMAEAKIKEILLSQGNQESFEEKEERLSGLERLQIEKDRKEKERSEIPYKYAELGYPIDVAQGAISRIDEQIKVLDCDICKLSQSTDIEEFLDRIPEILVKVFELCSKALSNQEIYAMKSEVYKLIEVTTFELSVSTKKELTVKLFDGLEDVLKLYKQLWLPELDSNQGPTG